MRSCPASSTPSIGASPEAPLLHPDLAHYEHVPFIFPQPGTNISNWFKVRKGDMAHGLGRGRPGAGAPLPGARTSSTCPIETHVCVAQQDVHGKITLWSSSQSPFAQRNLIANALDIGHSQLRVITPTLAAASAPRPASALRARPWHWPCTPRAGRSSCA